jgi:hypothetical protein
MIDQTPDIIAFDIATTTGWARGRVGTTPSSGSKRFGTVEASPGAVFKHAMEWFEETLTNAAPPSIVVWEALLPPTAKQGETQAHVRDRLAGLHAIVLGTAHRFGIYQTAIYQVADIRQHFIGHRNLKTVKAKRAVVERCRALGWPCESDDAGDALAAWHFACSLIDPAQALKVSPLFNKQLRVHVQ